MRFMVMHKMTPDMEDRFPPDPAILEGVGTLIQEGMKDGVFVSGEGLKPSTERQFVTYANGKRTVTNGPFREPKQLAAGYALLRVRSKEELFTWLDEFGALLGNVELFVGPVVEPWDLGAMPKPANPPLRFLSLHEEGPTAPGAAPPSPELLSQMGALIERMKQAGVLQATGSLGQTKRGARVRFERGSHTVTDGPFAESKELIAGYAILELPTRDAAIEWATRFGRIVRVNEVEVRELPAE